MKNIILFSLLVSLYGCTVSEKLLYNTWGVTEVKLNASKLNIPPAVRDTFIQKLQQTMTMTLNQDHTYSFKLMDKVKEGTWSFNASTKTLTTQSNDKKATGKIYTVNSKVMDLEFTTEDGLTLRMKMASKAK